MTGSVARELSAVREARGLAVRAGGMLNRTRTPSGGEYARGVRGGSLVVVAVAITLAGCHGGRRRTASRVDDARAAATVEDPWADTLTGWRADVDLVATELPRRHPAPFARVSEADFTRAVDALRRDLPRLTEDERVVGLARLVAMIGDAHTTLALPPGRAGAYPITFGWFTDGLVVIDGGAAVRAAIGWRLVDVGGVPVEAAIDRLSSTVGWQAEGHRRAEVAPRLAMPVYLRGTGLAPATGPVTFGLVDSAGVRRALDVEPGGWRPEPLPADRQPLYRQRPQAYYWSRWLDGPRAVYVQYNRCAEAPDLSMAAFTSAVMAQLDRVPDARLVVDLRWNGGGNSEVLKPFLAAIAARPALRGRLFALISRYTFSSALMNAIDLDRLGAVLVGEPAGSPASHPGEVHSLPLPAFGLVLHHSTRLFTYEGYDAPALAPDVTVELSSTDWLTGRDPVLTAALGGQDPTP